MGRLIYLLNVSADGYVETADRSLDWTVVDEELHAWFNEQMRSIDATIYGRRIYELMSAHWPTAEKDDPDITDVEREFARIWTPLPKIVFSTTLQEVQWNSRLVRGDVGEELARLRTEFDGDIGVAGATLAASFIHRGLVDEFRLVVHPVAIGGGTPYFPPLETPLRLRLAETHRFGSGAMYLRYSVER